TCFVRVLSDGRLFNPTVRFTSYSFRIYRETLSRFRAPLQMNLFRLSIADSTVSLGDWQILLPRAVVGTAAEVIIGVRPEHLELGGAGIEMDVDMVEELGADAYLYGRIVSGGCEMDQSIVARVDGRGPPERGSRVRLCPTPGHLHFFAVDGRRIPG
ncbi:TOBE domain-containing protein, partial [Mycobacterium tuberculosis]|uniref:TOBE domain-containing protein n=1 Tax=Mycobacterium tuberculosis TaxID=1773 RepID=UPI0032B32885